MPPSFPPRPDPPNFTFVTLRFSPALQKGPSPLQDAFFISPGGNCNIPDLQRVLHLPCRGARADLHHHGKVPAPFPVKCNSFNSNSSSQSLLWSPGCRNLYPGLLQTGWAEVQCLVTSPTMYSNENKNKYIKLEGSNLDPHSCISPFS